MDTATLQALTELASKGSNLSLFAVVYFAWMSYRALTRMEVMLELALRERGIAPPKVQRSPFTRRHEP